MWNWTGERTLEEKKDLENEIITAEKEFGVVSESNKELIESLKNLDDDIRSIKKKVIKNNAIMFIFLILIISDVLLKSWQLWIQRMRNILV